MSRITISETIHRVLVEEGDDVHLVVRIEEHTHPVTIEEGGGGGAELSDSDPSPVGLVTDTGTSVRASRSDHVHALPFSVVSDVLALADEDIDFNDVRLTHIQDPFADQDAATKIYVDTAIDAIPASPLSDSNPQALGTVDPGVSTSASRGDHVHAHGNLAGGSLHELATLVANGFMPAKHMRMVAHIFDVVEDGGADPTGVADSLAAFDASMASTARIVRVPKGHYKMSGTWHITRPVEVAGDGQEYASGSVLITQIGHTCIKVDYIPAPSARNAYIHDIQVQHNFAPQAWSSGTSGTAGATVFKPSNVYGGYQGLVFFCTVTGSAGVVEPTWPTEEGDTVSVGGGATFEARYLKGFHFAAPAMIERCLATGIGGDGFSVYASTADGENANGVLLTQCVATNCIGWGFYSAGADANSCTFINCSTLGNGQANLYSGSAPRGTLAELGEAYGGFCDNSFLGNRYFGCSAEGNYGYSFMVPRNALVGGQVNQSSFYGCYVESGQETAINQRAVYYGGLAPDGVYGSGNIQTWERANSLYFLNDVTGDGTGAMAYARIGRLLSQVVTEFGFSQDGYNPLQFGYGNVNGGALTGWAGYVYNGVATPFSISLANSSVGGGLAWLASRVFIGPGQSELKPQRLSGNLTVTVTDAGTDNLATHTWNRVNGTETGFATIAGALAYAPKDLNNYTLTITDSRSSGSEVLNAGGFVNGTLVLASPRLSTSTLRELRGLQITNAVISGAVTLQDCRTSLTGTASGSGRVLVKGGHADVRLTASSCTGVVLRAEHAQYVGHGIAASSCTANIVEMYNVQLSEIVGSGLTGSNPSAPYVVSLTGGGKHVLTGASCTSSTDWQLDLDGHGIKWSELSARNRMRAATFAYWGDNQWTYYMQMRIENDSSTPFDNIQTASIQIEEYIKEYCANRALPTTDTGGGDFSAGAFAEVTASATQDQADAVVVGHQKTIVKVCAADEDSIRFYTDLEVPGSGFGTDGFIVNGTVKEVALFPCSGKKIIAIGTDLGTNNPYYIPPGSRIDWLIDSAGNFYVN